MLNWTKVLEKGETKTKHHNDFCESLLLQHPDKIEISTDMIPVISFSDSFTKAPYTPPTGDYIIGFLGKTEVEVKYDLHNQVILKSVINVEI